MRTIDADHLRRWILSRVFKTQLSVADVIDQIDREDTIEPEIVRCKDCKYIRKWRSEESAKKFGQIYECARNVFDCPKPEDFCSHAERRTDDGD